MLKDIVFVIILSLSLNNAKGKIVIDNDAGGDDAMAIFLALLNEKYFDGPTVVGLTTGNGNTIEDNVFLNNQRILRVAKREDVPIYRGSKSSVVTTPETSAYYGTDGMGDNPDNFTNLVAAQEQGAVDALLELSKKYPGKLTVITIGTLTNVALAIKMDPDFLGRLEHLHVGAGHIHDERLPNPEFNAHMDVEAYHIVMQHASPDKVTVYPFSQTIHYLNIPLVWRTNVLGGLDTEIIRAQNRYEAVALVKKAIWDSLDPSVIAAAINPSLVQEYKYAKNDIVICGDKRGITTNTFTEKEQANVRLVYSTKIEEYKQFLLDVFSAELNAKPQKV